MWQEMHSSFLPFPVCKVIKMTTLYHLKKIAGIWILKNEIQPHVIDYDMLGLANKTLNG